MKNEELLLKLKEYQSFFIASLIFVVLVYLLSNFLLPNGVKIIQMLSEQNQLSDKEKMLSKKLEELSNIDEVEELVTLRKINIIIPEEKDIFSIFSGLDTQGADSGVVIEQSDFTAGVVSSGSANRQTSADNKPYKGVDVTLTTLSNKESFLKLLSNLSNFKTRFFTAHNFTIKFSSLDGLEASFILTTYYSPFPNILGTLETALPQLSGRLARIKEKIEQNALLPVDAEPEFEKGKTNLFQ